MSQALLLNPFRRAARSKTSNCDQKRYFRYAVRWVNKQQAYRRLYLPFNCGRVNGDFPPTVREKMTTTEEAEFLGKICVCGIVTGKRTEEVLLKMAGMEPSGASGA